MEILYKISADRYHILRDGATYAIEDPRDGDHVQVKHKGLGSDEKIIEYLNMTEGLMGTIVGLRIED